MAKVILDGGNYRMVDNDATILDQLPADIYKLTYDSESGYQLRLAQLSPLTETVFGSAHARVDKIFNLYAYTDRNVGVILSGPRGMGKTLTSRLILNRAVGRGIPAVIVEGNGPNLVKYLNSISSPLVVLFDEFEKNFPIAGEGTSPFKTKDVPGPTDVTTQYDMLGMFDGLTVASRRLWVITCNNTRLLDENLMNRPGRFHYHFKHEYLQGEAIKAYLVAHLPKSRYKEIDNVVQFGESVYRLNYDCLRAIKDEIALGTNFDDIIDELNILPSNFVRYTIEAEFTDGSFGDPASYYISSLMAAANAEPRDEVIELVVNGVQLCRIAFRLKDAVWLAGLGKYCIEKQHLPELHVAPERGGERWKLQALYLTPNLPKAAKHRAPVMFRDGKE